MEAVCSSVAAEASSVPAALSSAILAISSIARTRLSAPFACVSVRAEIASILTMLVSTVWTIDSIEVRACSSTPFPSRADCVLSVMEAMTSVDCELISLARREI